METFQLAEKTLAVHMVNGEPPDAESAPRCGDVFAGVVCGELEQREAEARLFHCCQSTSVETVTELTEFAKAVPGFQDLDLNDQVGICTNQRKTPFKYFKLQLIDVYCVCMYIYINYIVTNTVAK